MMKTNINVNKVIIMGLSLHNTNVSRYRWQKTGGKDLLSSPFLSSPLLTSPVIPSKLETRTDRSTLYAHS